MLDAIAGGTSLTADTTKSVELSFSSAITTALNLAPFIYTSEENLLTLDLETVSSQLCSQQNILTMVHNCIYLIIRVLCD